MKLLMRAPRGSSSGRGLLRGVMLRGSSGRLARSAPCRVLWRQTQFRVQFDGLRRSGRERHPHQQASGKRAPSWAWISSGQKRAFCDRRGIHTR